MILMMMMMMMMIIIIIIIIIINEHWYDRVPKSTEKGLNVRQPVQTYRNISDNKLDIIIRDNEKRNMRLNSCCNFRRQKCVKERG